MSICACFRTSVLTVMMLCMVFSCVIVTDALIPTPSQWVSIGSAQVSLSSTANDFTKVPIQQQPTFRPGRPLGVCIHCPGSSAGIGFRRNLWGKNWGDVVDESDHIAILAGTGMCPELLPHQSISPSFFQSAVFSVRLSSLSPPPPFDLPLA